ncbi:MAG: cytochrome c5 family protein [Desulfuromonas sp.]|nr:cytochrome c5 family protein [Desulfuromonas sp.]
MHFRTVPLIAFMFLFLCCATFGFAADVSKKSGAALQGLALIKGEEVYMQVCAVCHAAGVAGAPKVGDKDAWSPHIKLGFDHLVDSAIHGKGAMPPRGGQAGLSDDDVRSAVKYMVEKSK